LELRSALGRALLMAGAGGEVLALAVRHAAHREQFGRPIARLQAVGQELAAAGAEVAAVRAATLAAARTADRAGFGAEETFVAVAAAKIRAGMAATELARIAHQVHGAAGLVHGQRLATLTARLWAWRDEDGAESHWARLLGEQALRAGPDGIWAMVSQ
jgi:acyl-CoA dehydrogenase